MFFWIMTFAIAAWVFIDARKRQMDQPVVWALLTFLLMIFVLPYYLAKRNLKAGEVREGGTAWNTIKAFSGIWTLFMLFAGISAMVAAGNTVNSASTGAEQAGATIGTMLGLGMIMTVWFMVIVGALVIGLFMKKSSIVEHGPTGALAYGGETVMQWK